MLIEVENLKCGGCANSIRQALTALPGVQSVAVHADENQIELDVAEDADLGEIEQTLLHLGYPVAGQTQGLARTRAKAKSFVSCAVGRFAKNDQ